MVLFYRVNVSIRRVPIVSRNKFNDQTATTQVDLTIRIVKFTKSHYDNNHFFIWGQVGWYNFGRLLHNAADSYCRLVEIKAWKREKVIPNNSTEGVNSKLFQRALNNEDLQIILRWIMAAKSFIETSLLEECFYITYVYIHLHLLHTT